MLDLTATLHVDIYLIYAFYRKTWILGKMLNFLQDDSEML